MNIATKFGQLYESETADAILYSILLVVFHYY